MLHIVHLLQRRFGVRTPHLSTALAVVSALALGIGVLLAIH